RAGQARQVGQHTGRDPGGQDGVDVTGAGVLHLGPGLLLPGRHHLEERGLLVAAPGADHRDGLAVQVAAVAAVRRAAAGTAGDGPTGATAATHPHRATPESSASPWEKKTKQPPTRDDPPTPPPAPCLRPVFPPKQPPAGAPTRGKLQKLTFGPGDGRAPPAVT